MPNNQPTDADIEAEAKRWALDIAPQDTAFSPTMNAVSWWGLMSAHERNLARAHARYVLERRGRPEDVEAVARIVSKAYSNTESAWESVRFVDVALAIIAHYGPPPSPPQITDADVERCMIAYNHAYDAAFREHADLHAAGIRAAITAFLNPPPPDPIRAAETLHAPTSPWWIGTVVPTGRYRLKRDPWRKLHLQHLVTDTAGQRKRWVIVETVESGASDDA